MAFALAERVERSAGPRAGLVVYRPLTTSGDGEVRAKAILAALRCALALGDRAALTALTELWPTAHRGVWDAQVASLCKEMARLGAPFLSHAEALAPSTSTLDASTSAATRRRRAPSATRSSGRRRKGARTSRSLHA